jgi:hypothetical protein
MRPLTLAAATAALLLVPASAEARSCGYQSDVFPSVTRLEAHGTSCDRARDVAATIQSHHGLPRTITTYPTASRSRLRWTCSYRTSAVPGEAGTYGRRFACRRSGVSVTGRLGS